MIVVLQRIVEHVQHVDIADKHGQLDDAVIIEAVLDLIEQIIRNRIAVAHHGQSPVHGQALSNGEPVRLIQNLKRLIDPDARGKIDMGSDAELAGVLS